MSEGGYETISRQLFHKLKAQRLLLEYDDARSGSFEPLREVPDHKFVVLGLITTKEPKLESAVELRQRIIEASRFVPIDRLGLSPQCGFSSSVVGNRISLADQKRKLELVVRMARDLWG
ncbi:MAG TPA: vitamin-B12 independent methionine synthase [Candidatus Binatia bacterium]